MKYYYVQGNQTWQKKQRYASLSSRQLWKEGFFSVEKNSTTQHMYTHTHRERENIKQDGGPNPNKE
jgi:hypothetical protein